MALSSVAAAALLAAAYASARRSSATPAPLGGLTPVQFSELSTLDWCRVIEAALQRATPLGEVGRELAVAHAALESGYGQGQAARAGFNLWNLTAGPAWRGATALGGDRDDKGAPITQVWRVYDSVAQAVADYWDFLGPVANRGRYLAAREALRAGDSALFAERLHSAGYYQAPQQQYAAALAAVFSRVKGLL